MPAGETPPLGKGQEGGKLTWASVAPYIPLTLAVDDQQDVFRRQTTADDAMHGPDAIQQMILIPMAPKAFDRGITI